VYHWLEEKKYEYHHEIEQYKELESIIDQNENQTDEKKPSLKTVDFELVKERKNWKVIPANEIPCDIIDHIINLDIDIDQSHIERIKTGKGKSIDLVVTKNSNNYYTGSIKETITPGIEKKPGKNQHRHTNKMPPLEWEKKQELKKILYYLMVNEDFYNLVRRLLLIKWKSYFEDNTKILKTNDIR
jgi:hypothetical protein